MTRRLTAARVVGWLSIAAIVLAGVSGLLPWSKDQLIVLAGVVVRPPGVGGALLAAAGLLGVAHKILRSGATSSPVRRVRVLPRVACAVVVVAAVASVAQASILDIVSEYYVLEPASAGGCRVVVDQRSFLLLGSGVIHVLPAGEVLTREVSDYIADDGYRPFGLGTYQLTWQGEEAVVLTWGDANAPVDPELHRFVC
ncbi:MAG: hypothetical protein ACOH1Y_16860 [Propionicimonas sp.]